MLRNLLLPLALLALPSVATVAHAEPSERRAHHGDEDGADEDGHGIEGIAERVGLSDDQRAKVRALVKESKMARVDIRARIEKARIQVHDELSSPQPDAGAARKAIDAQSAAEAELRRNRVDLILAIRGVLTAEQWQKVLDAREDRREERREGKGGSGERRRDGEAHGKPKRR